MTILVTTNEATHVDERRARPPEIAAAPVCGQTYWALIDRSDNALLDFDTETLEHDDIDHARTLLIRYPTIYRNQLTIAKFIEGWIARIRNDAKPCRFNEGFVQALLDLTDHLRDGDFLAEPGDGSDTNECRSSAIDVTATSDIGS
jgi:hypothetical protein